MQKLTEETRQKCTEILVNLFVYDGEDEAREEKDKLLKEVKAKVKGGYNKMGPHIFEPGTHINDDGEEMELSPLAHIPNFLSIYWAHGEYQHEWNHDKVPVHSKWGDRLELHEAKNIPGLTPEEQESFRARLNELHGVVKAAEKARGEVETKIAAALEMYETFEELKQHWPEAFGVLSGRVLNQSLNLTEKP